MKAQADFGQSGAKVEAVDEEDVVFVGAAGADVLAERARNGQKRRIADVLAPGRVMVEGVVVDRLVGAAVDARVALFVAGEAERADRHRAREGMLVDRAAAARARVRFRGAGQQRERKSTRLNSSH